MTEPAPGRSPTVTALRRLLAPVVARIDAVREDMAETRRRVDEAGARLDQVSRQVERLEAYQQVSRDEVHRAFASLTTALRDADPDLSPGEILQRRLDHALLHAEALDAHTNERLGRELAELRSTLRLTQALAERAAASGGRVRAIDGEAAEGGSERSAAPAAPDLLDRFEHPTPSFDVLYRSFEDQHRGDAGSIRDRQRDDYLAMLSDLPNGELPIADLGCGRGELVDLLAEHGHPVIGVDSNLGQVVDGRPELFEQADLFDWLDAREDGSVRAVVAMHVVEHLPLELQIRLVFEARRVLAQGGLLVLETPNTLSLATAATNFWVDPTHQRPVHPLFLEFLAREAGFGTVESRPLHPLPIGFRGAEGATELVEDLDSLIFGSGDLALLARR